MVTCKSRRKEIGILYMYWEEKNENEKYLGKTEKAKMTSILGWREYNKTYFFQKKYN
jgi:hypothetical protein